MSKKKRIDWLNHTLEFFVVLIGILIAFQLNKCSTNRTQSDLVDNHLKYIDLECKENIEKLYSSLAHIESQISVCDSIIDEISAEKNIYKIRNYATSLLDMRNINLNTSAFDVLFQTGDIRFISDYEKKNEVVRLHSCFDRINGVNESNDRLYYTHFYPYLKSHFDLFNWENINASSSEEREKYYSKEFANTMTTYKFLLQVKLKTYKEERKNMQAYLDNKLKT